MWVAEAHILFPSSTINAYREVAAFCFAQLSAVVSEVLLALRKLNFSRSAVHGDTCRPLIVLFKDRRCEPK